MAGPEPLRYDCICQKCGIEFRSKRVRLFCSQRCYDANRHQRKIADNPPRPKRYFSIEKGERECTVCRQIKSFDEFHESSKSGAPGGKQSRCKLCSNARYAALSSDTRLANRLKYHNVTLEWYHETLERQGGGCAICGTNNPKTRGKDGRFAVDHDHSCCPGTHSCGACARGLLCTPCNMSLGGFNDSIETMQSAIRYLGAA